MSQLATHGSRSGDISIADRLCTMCRHNAVTSLVICMMQMGIESVHLMAALPAKEMAIVPTFFPPVRMKNWSGKTHGEANMFFRPSAG